MWKIFFFKHMKLLLDYDVLIICHKRLVLFYSMQNIPTYKILIYSPMRLTEKSAAYFRDKETEIQRWSQG